MKVSEEVQELHKIAISIMQTSTINVIIDNSLETAMTDFKNIFVTVQLVPPELRKFKRVVSRILDGEVSHEAGHIVITMPVKQKLKEWLERQPNPSLANIVHQCIEDKRVNYYILQRYRFDFAHRLQLLADVSNRLWIDTLKLKIAKERNKTADNVMKPESYFLENMLISIAAIEGMWGVGVEKLFDLSDEQKRFIRITKAIFDDARFDKMLMSIVRRHQILYDLWEKQLQKGENAEENCPNSVGGNLKLSPGMGTKKLLAKMEKSLKKAEEDAKAEEERERKKKDDDIKEGMAAGSGTGLNIPTPYPNEPAYQKIVQRNREHIERLLNLLKRLAKPKLVQEKWRKQGRFMTEILAKAYTSSIVHNVQGTYTNRTMQMEKTEACIGLLVDLSGSVRIEDAKDSLTTISEVCGRWLRDEDFAIMVFGSDYQKIKAYVEPYHTTKIRIGGMKCLGGTVLHKPLEELYKMMKAQRNHRTKILMIVSDFEVSEPQACKDLIKSIEKDGISVVGLGIDSTNERYIKTFCERAKYIGRINELPEAVFDLYREVSF